MKNRKNIICLIIVAVAIVSCKTSKPKTEIETIEELVVLEKYREATKECEKILYADTNQHSNDIRFLAADYLRLCLLKTGSLNSKYYAYKLNIKEMDYPIPFGPNVARACFQFECGIPLSTNEISIMLADGHQKSPVFWTLFNKNSIVTGRERYFESVKNAAISDNIAPIKISKDKITSEWQQKTQSMPPETKTHIDGNFLGSIYNLFQTNRSNKEILESYTAMVLAYGDLGEIPKIAERYNKLGYARLPDYVQEAVLIFLQTTEISDYCGFEIEEKIRKRHINFWQAVNNTYRGIGSPQKINKEYGDTYSYFYFASE